MDNGDIKRWFSYVLYHNNMGIIIWSKTCYVYILSFLSWWFNVGLVLLGICLSLATFCIVYLEWFKGIKHYDQEYPAIPPITTAAFIAASCRWSSWKNASHSKLLMWYLIIVAVFFLSCSFNIALWPVWSFFTPLILFTQFMGVVMLISLLGWMWFEERWTVCFFWNVRWEPSL